MPHNSIIKKISVVLILFIICTDSLHAQVWDSCGIDRPGVSSYSREHWDKLFVDIRDTLNGVRLTNIGTYDGVQWDSVGEGIDGAFYASAEYHNKVFIDRYGSRIITKMMGVIK